MTGAKLSIFLVVSFLLVVALALIDEDATGLRSVFLLENIPAFFIYGSIFFGFFLGADFLVRTIRTK